MTPFSIPVDILFALVSVVLGLRYGKQLFGRGMQLNGPVHVREAPALIILGFVFIIGITVFLAVRNNLVLAWYMPSAIEYYAIPVGWLVDLVVMGLFFGAFINLAWRNRSKLVWFAIALGLLVFATGEFVLRHSMWTRPPEVSKNYVTAHGIVIQTAQSTCAAVACANAARFYGKTLNEADLVRALGTTVDGTTASQIVYGMERLGFRCVKRIVPNSDPALLHAPAILYTTVRMPLDHTVLFAGFLERGLGELGAAIRIIDPPNGERFITIKKLHEMWQGHAIEIHLPEDSDS